MQFAIVSSDSQLLQSNSLLFHFKSKNEFILEICKVGHLKTQGYQWKIFGEMLESSLKNKLQSHFLEETFQLADSKSLRLFKTENFTI